MNQSGEGTSLEISDTFVNQNCKENYFFKISATATLLKKNVDQVYKPWNDCRQQKILLLFSLLQTLLGVH